MAESELVALIAAHFESITETGARWFIVALLLVISVAAFLAIPLELFLWSIAARWVLRRVAAVVKSRR